MNGTREFGIGGLGRKAPPGSDFLITGHESFGQVVEMLRRLTENREAIKVYVEVGAGANRN